MADCQAIRDRKQLIRSLRFANEPQQWIPYELKNIEGTEEELMRAWNILEGVVNEYKDGGDQIVENCTCGKHIFSKDHRRVGELVVDIKDDDNLITDTMRSHPSLSTSAPTNSRLASLTSLGTRHAHSKPHSWRSEVWQRTVRPAKFHEIISHGDQATVAMGLAWIAWVCHVHGILGVDTLVRQATEQFPYDTHPDIPT
jgi:hypothetical protein